MTSGRCMPSGIRCVPSKPVAARADFQIAVSIATTLEALSTSPGLKWPGPLSERFIQERAATNCACSIQSLMACRALSLFACRDSSD